MAWSEITLLLACSVFVLGEDVVYVSNSSHILSYTRDNAEAIPVYGGRGHIIVGLAVDIGDQLMFWSDNSEKFKGIYRADLDGHNVTEIVQGIDMGEVNSLSVDWVSNHLYFTDTKEKTVEIVSYDGSGRRVIVSQKLEKPMAITVSPIVGFIFWSDHSTNKIERAWLDGSQRRCIIKSKQYLPNQMSINHAFRKLYWVDDKANTIFSCNFRGKPIKAQKDLRKITHNAPAYGLVVIGNTAVISTWFSTSIISLLVETKVMDWTEEVKNLGTRELYNLASLDPVTQHMTYHPCSEADNGGCSHICLPSHRQMFRCACPSNSGLVLTTNGQTCEAPKEIILATFRDIGLVGFISLDDSHTKDVEPVGVSPAPHCVTYDPVGQTVYWTDWDTATIYQSKLNEKRQSVFMNLPGKVRELDFNYLTGNLYVLSSVYIKENQKGNTYDLYIQHIIEMINVKSGKRKILFTAHDLPRGFALALKEGFMYISLAMSDKREIRTDLEGRDPEMLLEQEAVWPWHVITSSDGVYMPMSYVHENKQEFSIHQYNTTSGMLSEGLLSFRRTAPFNLAVSDNTLFYVDAYVFEIGHTIRAVTVGTNETQTFVTQDVAYGIYYSPAKIDTDNDNSSCGKNGCGYFCPKFSATGDGLKQCACPDESPYIVKKEDSEFCTRPENYLIFADRTTIQMVSLDLETDSRPAILYYGPANSNYMALTYNSISDRLFWSDLSSDTIYMTRISNFKPAALFREGGHVNSIAVNEEREILYWTVAPSGTELGYIAKLSLKRSLDSYRKIVTDLDKPGAIVLDPKKKTLYWSERRQTHPGYNYEVHVAKVTGRRHRTLMVLSEDQVPTTMVLHDDQLYVGCENGMIVIADLEGSDSKEIQLASVKKMYGLVAFQHILIYTEWSNSSIKLYDTATEKVIPMVTKLMRPSSVVIHHKNNLKDNACFHGDESPCSDGCIPLIKGLYHCTCPEGKLLGEDEETCVIEGEATTLNSTFTPVVSPTAPDLMTSMVTITTTTMETKYGMEPEVYEDSDTDVKTGQPSSTTSTTKTTSRTTTTTTSTFPDYSPKEFVAKAVEYYPVVEEDGVRLEPLEPPHIENCPSGETILLNLPSDGKIAVLPLRLMAYDSEGGALELKSNHEFDEDGIRIPWEGSEEESRHIMVFKAEDTFHQEALCEFNVVLQDVDPPVFKACPDGMTLRTEKMTTPAHWSVPEVTDNVEVKTLVKSHMPGALFPPGNNVVNYTAVDIAGNQAYCVFVVVVLQDNLCELPQISNGGIVCNHGDTNDGDCKIICEDGYVVNPIRIFRKDFNCKHPDDIAAMNRAMKTQKACLFRRYPSLATQEFRLLFRGPINKHREEVTSYLADTITRHLGEQKSCVSRVCYLGNLTVPCSTNDTLCVEEEVDRESFYIAFNVTLSNSTAAVDQALSLDVEKTLDKIHLDLTALATMIHIKMEDHHFTAVSDRITASNTVWSCPPGQITEQNSCIACPVGTYQNQSLDICQYCGKGYYQSEEGHTSCIRCNAGEISPEGATLHTDCKTIPSMDEMTLFLIVTACTFGVVFLCMAITLYLQFQRQQKRNKQAATQKKPRYMTPNIYVAPPPILKSKLLDENTTIGPRSYSIDKKHPFNIYANHDYEDVDGNTNSTTTTTTTTTPMTVYQNDLFNMSPGFGMKTPNGEGSPTDGHSTMSRENTFSKYSPKFAVRKNSPSNGAPSPIQQRKMSRDSTFSNHSPKMMRAQRTPSSDTPLITQSPLLRMKLAAYNFNHDDQ